MKRIKITAVLFLLVLVCFNQPAMAQEIRPGPPSPAEGLPNLPSLSDEQKNLLKEQRLARMKEIQPVKNELGEVKARFKSLSEAQKPDQSAINKNIDAQTELMNRIMKINASHHQAIRRILTDEQRIIFDTMKGAKKRKGFQPIPGQGPFPERGNFPPAGPVF